MGTDAELAAIGKNIKRAALVQQAKVSAHQARDEATELAKCGWPTQRTEQLEAQISAVEQLFIKQSTLREEARNASEALAIVLDEGRTYIRKLRAALRPILRALPRGDTTKAMFKMDASLHNSVANLSAYLTKIRPGVEHLAPQLQSVLSGSPLQTLDDLRAKLNTVSTTAAVARNRIPEVTQAMNAAKGAVMLSLRDLLEFARVAFDADRVRVGKFYFDLLSGREPKPATTVTVSPATPASPPVVPSGGTGGAP